MSQLTAEDKEEASKVLLDTIELLKDDKIKSYLLITVDHESNPSSDRACHAKEAMALLAAVRLAEFDLIIDMNRCMGVNRK